jgi:hypothetical protein
MLLLVLLFGIVGDLLVVLVLTGDQDSFVLIDLCCC